MTDQPCNRPTEIPVHWEVVLPTRIIRPFLVLRQLLCSLQKVDIPRSMTKSDQTHLIDNVIFLVLTKYLPGLGIDKRKKESEQESKHARVHAKTHASTQTRTRPRKHARVHAKKNSIKKTRTRTRKHALVQESVHAKKNSGKKTRTQTRVRFCVDACVFSCFLTFFFSFINSQPWIVCLNTEPISVRTSSPELYASRRTLYLQHIPIVDLKLK